MYKKQVLIVDDEKNIASSLKRLLRNEDYNVFTAESGAHGLEILKKEEIQVVVSDQRMPVMSGIEFLQKVKELYPQTIRIILSGYAEIDTVVEAINKGEVYRFLTKPWQDDDLKITINHCFSQYDMEKEHTDLIDLLQYKNKELTELSSKIDALVIGEKKIVDRNVSSKSAIAGINQDGVISFVNEVVKDIDAMISPHVIGHNITEYFSEEINKLFETFKNSDEADGIFNCSESQNIKKLHISKLLASQKNNNFVLLFELGN